MKVGITLPSFVEDPEILLRVARDADEAGIDGAFVFEHLFRTANDGTRRNALDCWGSLGAVAIETETIRFGPLVARASLRPAAVLAHACETLARIGGSRLLAVIGAGDSQSQKENEEFGVSFSTIEDRVAGVRSAVEATRAAGVETWVAGSEDSLLELTSTADGWNQWGTDTNTFRATARLVKNFNPDAILSWSGILVIDETDELAESKAARLQPSASALVGSPRTIAARLNEYVEAGADWIVLAPADSSNTANVPRLAEVKERLNVA